LYHTLRHLRPVQIYGRLWFRLYRPRPGAVGLPTLLLPTGLWTTAARREASMISRDRFRFLGEDGAVETRADWNRPDRNKLWLYNLHYFDDLSAEGAERRTDWHRGLIRRWVAENPPFFGNGWEPYPTSLRIVNWLKWGLAGNALEPEWGASLALQARYLRRRLEHHLLGNHLFANAKALCFAGLCFEGAEADAWLAAGLRVLERELPEQVPKDGGHFERSPMYHSIILEDLLDLLNLARTRGRPPAGAGGAEGLDLRLTRAASAWRETVQRMRRWLALMCHPDGEIALFNDAAFGIAPSPAELEAYAQRLGLGEMPVEPRVVEHLADSGYVRLQLGPAFAILDVGAIGPDYLPGHAHADTLSFELSVHGRRLVVDSGTSCYGSSAERLRQRGTAAHNTLAVDGASSSEVWSGFRVARRAYPFDLGIGETAEGLRVTCAHDGYRRLPGSPVHRRTWILNPDRLSIRDRVDGRFGRAVTRLHLHPAVRVRVGSDGACGELDWGERTPAVRWSVAGALAVRVVDATYHPRFGISQFCRCIEADCGPDGIETLLAWSPGAPTDIRPCASSF
jgi:uncharacterized heparinase superfamily protein